MKYIKQFGIIMAVTCLGEVLKQLIDLPIPSTIYGLCLMLFFLMSGIIKIENVRETGVFLLEIMPIMFIPPSVGLIASWTQLKPMLVALIVISVVSTVLVMVVSGLVVQGIMKRGKNNE